MLVSSVGMPYTQRKISTGVGIKEKSGITLVASSTNGVAEEQIAKSVTQTNRTETNATTFATLLLHE